MANAEELFFFNDTATTEIYTLSLHDALPILRGRGLTSERACRCGCSRAARSTPASRCSGTSRRRRGRRRSEEHTSELQSRQYLVCRLLLEKNKKYQTCVLNSSLLHCTHVDLS